MRHDSKKQQTFTRRALILGSFKIGLLGLITSRMYYLQLIKHDEYQIKSENNHIKYVPINPVRGNILDIYGRRIASNYSYYQILIIKTKNIDYTKLVYKISKIIQFDSNNDVLFFINKIKNSSYNTQIIIKDHINWEEIAKIEFHSYTLPSVRVALNQFRVYEHKETTSHITGYISVASQNNIKEDKFYQTGVNTEFKVGKNGLELAYDKILRGKFGQKKIEVDAHSNIISEFDERPAQNGLDIKTSINLDVQNYLHNLFSDVQGAGLVIDIRSGQVVAMVSTPNYDPNIFIKKISKKDWQEINTKNNSPLINKAISNPYPPGSTFKLITALAILDTNVSPNYNVKCTGHVEINGRVFRCWNKFGHGNMNLENALIYSCSVYFYVISKMIGIEKIANLAKLFGLGQLTNIELPYERPGTIPDKSWKLQKIKQPWHVGDTVNTSIGQGYCLMTPLQMALMSAKIASGKNIIPSMLYGSSNNKQKLPIKNESLDIVRQAMYEVVNLSGGSAYSSRLNIPAWEMAGKTGTAQVISKNNTDINLSGTNIKFSQRNHGIFTGFAPFHNPKYSFAIVAEHSGSGSQGAAPIAKSIMQHIYNLDLE